MKKSILLLLVTMILLPLGLIAQVEKTSNDYDGVKKAIETMIGWAIEKDFDALFAVTAHDPNFFHLWLMSNSQVIGYDNWVKYAERWKDPGFKGTRFEFKDLRINFSQDGNVAWYSTYIDDCGEFNGEESCLNDVFQTGVLEKRDGKWVHTQIHGSYPVDKVPAFYIKHFYKDLFKAQENKPEEKK
ncbi:MAG: nuclear transport factor 2 family protein [Acidobacteria bacterium]|nr:nuclear transport factor 2 family protein [Acidobacteriota bacterium]